MNSLKFETVSLSMVVGLVMFAGIRSSTPGSGGTMQCGLGMFPYKPGAPVATTRTLKITATMPAHPKTGGNVLNIVITTVAGKPVAGAKVTAEVAMTSMDMGTDRPPVKETGKGHYTATAVFTMAGPWAVTVHVALAGQKLQSKSFDFAAN